MQIVDFSHNLFPGIDRKGSVRMNYDKVTVRSDHDTFCVSTVKLPR